MTPKKNSTRKFGKIDFLVEEFDYINQCSYYDYQREKIYFRDRTKRYSKSRRSSSRRSRKYKINKEVYIPLPTQCRNCGSNALYKHGSQRKTSHDIRFSKTGVKRWVVRYVTKRVKCRSCGCAFSSPEYNSVGKFGRGLYVWTVYNMIVLRQTSGLIKEGLIGIFNYDLGSQICTIAKTSLAEYYKVTYESILDRLKNGDLIHADETLVSIRGVRSYVWVFASLEEVAYVYSPTREAEVLKQHLEGFKGVLVSDFYGAYDSMECPQQKCLIHLIRDMNDDLRKYPFDEEYKALIQDFGKLLKMIIVTIDKYGLKKRHLRKHRKDTDRFFRNLLRTDCQSEVSIKYRRRLEKCKDRLFTFLDYDGVPWNNNNAEHAIKAFALYRRITNGCFTEEGIRRYLILLSVYETCKYKNIDFLQFLLSGDTDIDEYTSRRTRKKGGRK